MMATENTKAAFAGANLGHAESDVISMDASRSKRFIRTLLELSDAVTSLQTAVRHFPEPQCGRGDIEPRITVQAFTSKMDSLLALLTAMAVNEEHLNEDQREDDHA